MIAVVVVSASLAGCGAGEVSSAEDDRDQVSDGDTSTGLEDAAAGRQELLDQVETWFYYLSFDPEEDTFRQVTQSTYDLIVIEPIFTEEQNTDFDMAAVVQNLHGSNESKLVLAYIDIGQAEEWRTYWEPDWEIGDPDWIVADDPDGWEGNFPVAYWRDEWQDIWLEDDGYLQRLIDSGFDGVYLDWVEAYSDENVLTAAADDDVDAREEMVDWVGDIADFGREQDEDFIVIAQNAAELAEDSDYVEIIDAIAQEQVWFDGAADNDPPGDCPLPRTEAEVDSEEYEESLGESCRDTYDQFPESTLHVSSEAYINDLVAARDQGLTIFTIDYALDPDNIAWIYQKSRGLGFIPFVSERELGTYMEPYS
jgi:cysteinyl-tRNA synthetase